MIMFFTSTFAYSSFCDLLSTPASFGSWIIEMGLWIPWQSYLLCSTNIQKKTSIIYSSRMFHGANKNYKLAAFLPNYESQ